MVVVFNYKLHKLNRFLVLESHENHVQSTLKLTARQFQMTQTWTPVDLSGATSNSSHVTSVTLCNTWQLVSRRDHTADGISRMLVFNAMIFIGNIHRYPGAIFLIFSYFWWRGAQPHFDAHCSWSICAAAAKISAEPPISQLSFLWTSVRVLHLSH